ncbi:MAG TPA: DnaJ domain-containing protein [Verrucomicrobiae bacterium]|jgi:hypothetical protein
MNETSRCCRVLNVTHGATFEEVKAEYRDLVKIWHPDRFSENDRLRKKAQERLKEINLAWEYLCANGFQEGVLAEPQEDTFKESPPADAQSPQGPAAVPSQSRYVFWLSWLGVNAILVCGAFFYTCYHFAPRREMAPAPVLSPITTPESAVAKPAEPPADEVIARDFPFVIDVLGAQHFTNSSGWLQAAPLLNPPFAMRVKLTVDDLAEFRLHYGLGQVVFNWDGSAKELLMESPRTSKFESFRHQGILLPHEPHEIIWDVESNRMRVRVDGKIRGETNGNFAGVKGFASLGPYSGAVKLNRFDIETPEEPKSAPASARGLAEVPGDLLHSMVAEQNVSKSNEPDGLAIQTSTDSADRLMTSQAFQAPFVIRTRAQTDGYNLRLYCGAGMVIFNWELNERELRVHDPLNGQPYAATGSGLISPNEWHDVVWDIQKYGMKLFVDGQLRFENRKDYRSLNTKVGIGPFKSKVTIAYFQVEKK